MPDQHLLQRKRGDRFELEVDLSCDIGAFDAESPNEEAIAWKQGGFSL
jgi:hypothetical protein